MQRLLLKKQIGQRVVEDAVNRVKGEDDKKEDGRVNKEVVEENDKEEDEKREGDFLKDCLTSREIWMWKEYVKQIKHTRMMSF